MPREVQLTHPDRVLFPEDGITKGELFAYYERVAPVLVPHLRERPFTMKRYREGIAGPGFFQKQAPKGMPSWIPTRRFETHPREGGSRLVDFPLVNSAEALLWMVQMHCIDMNAWYSRVDRPGRPDYVVFDLDPPEASNEDGPGGFALAVEVAHLIRSLLDEVGLPGHVKTSGADGIHVLAPVQRRASFDDTYAFAEAASQLLERRHPGSVTTQWLKRKRSGVLVDHRQNGWGKTIASVYSVRPRPGAPVSTPLRWEELTPDVRPRHFTIPAVLERIERHGDLYAPVLEEKRPLAAAARRLARLAPYFPARGSRAGRMAARPPAAILRGMSTFPAHEPPPPPGRFLVTLLAAGVGFAVLLTGLAVGVLEHGRWAFALVPVAVLCFAAAAWPWRALLRRRR